MRGGWGSLLDGATFSCGPDRWRRRLGRRFGCGRPSRLRTVLYVAQYVILGNPAADTGAFYLGQVDRVLFGDLAN
jgi:hypothetical protein